jgi:hypothetical protein
MSGILLHPILRIQNRTESLDITNFSLPKNGRLKFQDLDGLPLPKYELFEKFTLAFRKIDKAA